MSRVFPRGGGAQVGLELRVLGVEGVEGLVGDVAVREGPAGDGQAVVVGELVGCRREAVDPAAGVVVPEGLVGDGGELVLLLDYFCVPLQTAVLQIS